MKDASPQVDAIDRRILAELETDGRMSIVDLAPRVGLSATPCQRRVKRLEADGGIRGYVSGEYDYLLHVMVADLDAFSAFSLKALLRMPGVRDTRSSLVMGVAKEGPA